MTTLTEIDPALLEEFDLSIPCDCLFIKAGYLLLFGPDPSAPVAKKCDNPAEHIAYTECGCTRLFCQTHLAVAIDDGVFACAKCNHITSVLRSEKL